MTIINRENPFVPYKKPAHIKLDLTPAHSSHLPESLNTRIIVTDEHYYIFGAGPALIESGEMVSFEMPEAGRYILNGEYTIKRPQRCDCGTSLKGFHPFAGVRYAPFRINK